MSAWECLGWTAAVSASLVVAMVAVVVVTTGFKALKRNSPRRKTIDG